MAVISIRLLVVCASLPWSCWRISPSSTHTTPHPPAPGFGLHPPSVNTPVCGPPLYLSNTSSRRRFSSATRPREAPLDLRDGLLFAAAPDFVPALCLRHRRGTQLGYWARTASERVKTVLHSTQVKSGMGELSLRAICCKRWFFVFVRRKIGSARPASCGPLLGQKFNIRI